MIVGVDGAIESVELAANRLRNGLCCRVSAMGPTSLGYNDAAFDVVLCIQDGISRHPTQLYGVPGLAVIAVIRPRLDRDRGKGTLLLWFLMHYGVTRPCTEVFRADYSRDGRIRPSTASQFVCLSGALTAALILVIQRHKARRPVFLPLPFGDRTDIG